ncbi:HAD family hydrolase [Actinosynnema mirum]|uniref:HAD-superfamily hydrolase, subfamily IA, variant 3 n=1 Tax=Actinosynnema mirum (strain ATCC 29888 / DSM 43827 / JCM 3225 / NBRC 14064 / NCIMB 13271 / NRRL B-12336 / IMRU 3971 / 101) TaxID=446462 RepID=C6WAN5_ACTMD|nr:HAD family phosphatase [Actinosynnema mirum]ACU37354.1 HAD-superfamily hydrolase, subfamily IA, variant 3 [Actinosynnema mirum DSM 43827]
MVNARTRPVDAVVLDWGGVMTVPVPAFVDSWLTAERIDRERYTTTLRAWMGRSAPPDTPVARLETGELPVAEFEALLAAELTTLDGTAVPAPGLLRRMFGQAHPDPAMVDLVRSARAAGLTTALLSNSWGEGYPEQLLLELFDVVVVSGRVGLRKPDPAIFAHTVDRVGAPASRCAFFDDMPGNVEGARAAGLLAHRHTSADETRRVLESLLGGAL